MAKTRINLKLLLDTNSLIWILDDRDKDSFGKNALKKIAEVESLIFLTSDKLIIDLGLPFVIDARK